MDAFFRVVGLRSIDEGTEEDIIDVLELRDKLAPPSVAWRLRPLPWIGVFIALAERIFDLLGVVAPEFLRAPDEIDFPGLLRLVILVGWTRSPFCEKLSKANLISEGMDTR